MDAHAAFVGCFTDRCSAVQLPPLRHDCHPVLGRHPFADCRRSVVLRQSGRFTGQFRGSSVPHAAVVLIATVPVSIAGWGVRERHHRRFTYADLAQSDGLALSILFGAASFVIGVVGGIISIVSGLRLRPFDEARGAEACADNTRRR